MPRRSGNYGNWFEPCLNVEFLRTTDQISLSRPTFIVDVCLLGQIFKKKFYVFLRFQIIQKQKKAQQDPEIERVMGERDLLGADGSLGR